MAERNMDGLPPDVKSLWSDMKNQEKEIRRKRQWLMGLPAPAGSSRKRLKSNELMLPETMLREDDLFYGSLKKHVEKGFGVCNEANELPTTHDADPFVQHKMVKTILALLEDFTNNGLYVLAKLIAGSSVAFEKTRWKMKKFIKENLPKVLRKQCNSDNEVEVCRKFSQILKDPHNFQMNHALLSTLPANLTVRPTVQSHYDATEIVLDRLKDMSLQTLCAMYRRLQGVKGSLPTLDPPRTGWNKARLVNRVKSMSLKMLSKLDKLDELPEPLIKAMEIAGLSFKLSDCQNASITNFCNYSPEIESLQNEIIKAISLLNSKVGVQELKGLKELLAPGSEYEVLNGGLRKAIIRMLIEFLFECSDMDEIPIILLDALAIINGFALQQKEVVEEVETILNVSAQVKQIFWDSMADYGLDLDFSNAYMEDLEESDDGELSDDNEEEEELVTNNFDNFSEVGSTADSHCQSSGKIESVMFVEDCESKLPCGKMDTVSENSHMCRNKYLAVQQACDETSLIAYRLIGRVLEGYARIEEVDLEHRELTYLNDGNLFAGDFQDTVPNEDQAASTDDVDSSIIIQAVQELIPLFSNSELEKVRKILR